MLQIMQVDSVNGLKKNVLTKLVKLPQQMYHQLKDVTLICLDVLWNQQSNVRLKFVKISFSQLTQTVKKQRLDVHLMVQIVLLEQSVQLLDKLVVLHKQMENNVNGQLHQLVLLKLVQLPQPLMTISQNHNVLLISLDAQLNLERDVQLKILVLLLMLKLLVLLQLMELNVFGMSVNVEILIVKTILVKPMQNVKLKELIAQLD